MNGVMDCIQVSSFRTFCKVKFATQCFLKLVELGVPFPRNRYVEYIGYKTAHGGKSRGRAFVFCTGRPLVRCGGIWGRQRISRRFWRAAALKSPVSRLARRAV